MGSNGHHPPKRGKGDSQKLKQDPQYKHTIITENELVTLKSVLYGYIGFLKNLREPDSEATQRRLQLISNRLSEHLEGGETLYFSYEERIAILEAVVGFKLLLVTVFPPTEKRESALVDVERLYQCLINARSLPLN